MYYTSTSSVVPEEYTFQRRNCSRSFMCTIVVPDGAPLCGMSAESYGINKSNSLCRMNVFHEVVYSTGSKAV
jgi:hypothetical protein